MASTSASFARAYVPIYGEESMSSAEASSLYYPLDIYVPCRPQTTKVYSLITMDIVMALISLVCISITIVLCGFAVRAVWRAKTVRDQSTLAFASVEAFEQTKNVAHDDNGEETSTEGESDLDDDLDDDDDDDAFENDHAFADGHDDGEDNLLEAEAEEFEEMDEGEEEEEYFDDENGDDDD